MLKTIPIGLIAFLGVGIAAAQAPAETEAQYLEIQRARTDMDQARRQLEEAARTIATQVHVLPDLEHLNADLGNLRYQLRAVPFFAGQTQIGAMIVDSEMGALVTQVTPGGGAEAAGLKVGDVIQSIDGQSISTADERPSEALTSRLGDVESGDTVALVVERAGQTLNFDVEASAGPAWARSLPGFTESRQGYTELLGQVDAPNVTVFAPSEGVFHSWGFASSPWGDMELVAVSEGLGRYFDTEEGLLVVHAPEDDAIDVQDGDVILSISGRTPNSPEHAIRILSSFESGETVELSIMRDGRRQTVEYTIPEQSVARWIGVPPAPARAAARAPAPASAPTPAAPPVPTPD